MIGSGTDEHCPLLTLFSHDLLDLYVHMLQFQVVWANHQLGSYALFETVFSCLAEAETGRGVVLIFSSGLAMFFVLLRLLPSFEKT